jgi:hypothetical protein
MTDRLDQIFRSGGGRHSIRCAGRAFGTRLLRNFNVLTPHRIPDRLTVLLYRPHAPQPDFFLQDEAAFDHQDLLDDRDHRRVTFLSDRNLSGKFYHGQRKKLVLLLL